MAPQSAVSLRESSPSRNDRGVPHQGDALQLAAHALDKSLSGRPIIKAATLIVAPGEIVGLVGAPGSGKTTLLHLLGGLSAPDAGRIALDGRDITAEPANRREQLGIGFLRQQPHPPLRPSVEANIRAVLERVEPDRDRREEELQSILDRHALWRVRRTPAGALSGGELRRLALARLIATRPGYVLLDQPSAGIDPIAAIDIGYLLRQWAREGFGVLVVELDWRDTLELADRAYGIVDGTVIEPPKFV
jgi:lipopolysaccharide export system ATP-binding protein